MSHDKKNPNSRVNELAEITSVLIGKQLAEVWYHDGVGEDGAAYFLEDVDPNRHDLMQGVDLVTKDGVTLGFFWGWNSKKGEFQLSVEQKSVGNILEDGWVRFDQSKEVHWSDRMGKTITNTIFSRNVDDKYPVNIICDCRLDFENAPSLWICARASSIDCTDNGDDTIVVFTEQEARRIGIKVDAE